MYIFLHMHRSGNRTAPSTSRGATCMRLGRVCGPDSYAHVAILVETAVLLYAIVSVPNNGCTLSTRSRSRRRYPSEVVT